MCNETRLTMKLCENFTENVRILRLKIEFGAL